MKKINLFYPFHLNLVHAISFEIFQVQKKIPEFFVEVLQKKIYPKSFSPIPGRGKKDEHLTPDYQIN